MLNELRRRLAAAREGATPSTEPTLAEAIAANPSPAHTPDESDPTDDGDPWEVDRYNTYHNYGITR